MNAKQIESKAANIYTKTLSIASQIMILTTVVFIGIFYYHKDLHALISTIVLMQCLTFAIYCKINKLW